MPTPQAYSRLYEEHETLKSALRTPYASLFMDGRNEHGTHLLEIAGGTSLPDPDRFVRDALHSRDEMAEAIFSAAEKHGHDVGHCIVVRVIAPQHDEDCWEFVSIDETLTAVMHGTPAEQAACFNEAA